MLIFARNVIYVQGDICTSHLYIWVCCSYAWRPNQQQRTVEYSSMPTWSPLFKLGSSKSDRIVSFDSTRWDLRRAERSRLPDLICLRGMSWMTPLISRCLIFWCDNIGFWFDPFDFLSWMSFHFLKCFKSYFEDVDWFLNCVWCWTF